jgi:type I restriction enzyme, S subunit
MYFEYIHSEIIDDRIDAQFFTPEYIKSLKKINQFRIETLGNISRRIFDPPHTAPEFVDKSDFEMIMIENITLNGIEGNFRAISETCHKDIFKNSHLEGNELLVSRVGNSSGTFASVFPCYKGKNVSGNISIIKLKDEIIDKEYAFAYFNSNIGQNSIKRNIANTARKFLTISKIREFQVPIPSSEIQKYIGDKVRKAEELREEAKRLKKEAEEILNAELKLSYFNERVKDAPKMYNWIYGESIEVRIDSQYYINGTNFINNEMYKKGLKLKRISEIANVGKGFSYTSLDNKSIPYIRISDLDDLLINFDTVELVDEKTYLEKKSSQLEQCDLIFAITGATIGKVSLFYTSKHSKATLSSDTAFVRLQDKNDAAYVLLYLKSFIGQLGILKGVTGATNRHLSLEHIGDIFIPVIDNKLKREINMRVIKAIDNVYLSKQLIQEAKQDVEDLIEGNFDTSKVRANS